MTDLKPYPDSDSFRQGYEEGQRTYHGKSTRHHYIPPPGSKQSREYWNGYYMGYAHEGNTTRE